MSQLPLYTVQALHRNRVPVSDAVVVARRGRGAGGFGRRRRGTRGRVLPPLGRPIRRRQSVTLLICVPPLFRLQSIL